MFKRVLKLLVRLVALAAVLLGVIAVYSYHLSKGKPAWFDLEILTPEQRAAAVNRAYQKSADTISYAADIVAAQGRRRSKKTAATPTQPAILLGPKTVSVTQGELNAFMESWDGNQTSPISSRIDQYVSEAQLVLVDRYLVLIGTLKNTGVADGMAVSIELTPTVDEQGRFLLHIEQIYGGRLPVPRSLFSTQEQKMHDLLLNDLPRWQDQAAMQANGTVGKYAVESQYAKFCLGALDDQPVDATFFLPSGATDPHHSVPVKLTEVKVENQTLTFTLRPLTDGELAEVVPDIQKPYGTDDPPDAGKE